MANTKKKHYYVLVLTTEGPKFVTKIDNANKTAEYNMLEKPMKFGSKSYAEDVALGLCLNMVTAFAIANPWEVENQPFLYDKGKFEWKWNEEEK